MVEERMKTALQSKLPEPPDGFGERNDQLISSLMSGREKQYASREKHRILVPAIVIAIMMMLGIGIAASNGHWGVFNWLSENRSQEINTDQPFMIEGETPFLPPVDTDHVTITVREAQSDGYGLYLSVVFTPKEKDALAFNWGINPFQDGPEIVGLAADYKNQTLAEWAVNHGYHKLIRVALLSIPYPSIPKEIKTTDEMAAYLEEQGIPFRRTKDGAIQYDHISSGPEFDSYLNNKMMIEEDGSTLIMVAGGCLSGQEDYQMNWTAVPCLMHEDGTWDTKTPEWKIDEWRQGTISVHIPESTHSKPVILANYVGTMKSMNRAEDDVTVKVQLIRTELNDYFQIQCPDLERSYQSPWLYLEDEISSFARSGIHSYSVQEKEGMLVFTTASLIPGEIPDKLIIRWYDSGYDEKTVIERVD